MELAAELDLEWPAGCGARRSSAGYALAIDDDGRVVGGVPFAVVHHETNRFYDWTTLAGERGVTLPPGGRLLAGPRRGYRTEIFAAHRSAARCLVDRLLEHATSLGRCGVIALFCDSATALAIRDSFADALVLHIADDATIDLPGGCFDDYLQALHGHRRQRVRRELRDFAAARYQVRHHTLAEVAALAGPLLGQVQARYGHPADPEALARSLAAQGRAMGSTAEVLTLARGSEVVGFVCFYCHGDTLYLRAAGFDYARLRGAAEYFNLVYYLPLQLCYERKLRRVHAGIEAARAKALRGAALRPLWLVDVAHHAAGRDQRSQAMRHNADALRGLRADLPSGAAIDAAAWEPFVDGGTA